MTGPRLDWKAVASPLCGVLAVLAWILYTFPGECAARQNAGWLIPFFLLPIVAVGFGHWSRRDVRKRPHLLKGRGVALTGLILSYALLVGILLSSTSTVDRWPQAARESSAVANLRTIAGAEAAYLSRGRGYGSLTALVEAGLLEPRFEGVVSCYELRVVASGDAYTATAVPISTDAGRFGYYAEADGVIRYSTAISLAPSGYSGRPVE